MGTFFDTTYNKILGTLALAALVAALGAYAYYTLKQSEYLYMGPTTITVTGEAEVTAVPNEGQFTYTVMATGTDQAAAQAAAASIGNAVLAYLRDEGVAEGDIKSEQYQLTPRFRWEEAVCRTGVPCVPGKQIPDGYDVSQLVTVTLKDVSKAGTLMSGVGERGASMLSNLTFVVGDDEELRNQARAAAIEDAMEESKVLAEQLGVRIVRFSGYFEESGMPTPYPYAMMDGATKMEAAPVPELPVGETEIKSRVNLTFIVE
jgi:uncharacterized protein YggE